MMGYLLVSGLVVVAAITALTYFLKINLVPVVLLGAVLVFGLNPLVYNVGSEITKDQATTFNEYWNGYETEAVRVDTACTIDGACAHTYDCDPYPVTVTKYRTVSDGKGGTTSQPYQDVEIHYHSCPYSQQETTFTVKSTVDNYTIASNVMTGGPYRTGSGIPGGQVTSEPAAWAEARNRIAAGKPGPVTAVKPYKNYILASQETLFKAYADNIEDLKGKGLLPAPSKGVYGLYHATKAYMVSGANVPLFNDYKTDVEYLDGAVGKDLHGDLHVVFVPENIESGKDDYLNTLTAYWQSKEHGKDAISKNAIIVVIGVATDGKTVAWAKATTGMPMGNEAMLTQIGSDLKGKPMDANLIGRPSMNPSDKKLIPSSGALEKILWGEHAFSRVSMSGGNDNGSGFKYLRDEMQPSGWDIFVMALVNTIVGGLMITGFIFLIINDVLPSKFARWKGTVEDSRNTKRRSPHSSYYF